jgi:hypothetical protein
MLEGSILVAFIFKIHYKAMFSTFASKHKYQSRKGETLLLQTDLSRSNTIVPKVIQWKDITLLDDWILEGATHPRIPQPPQPNVQILMVKSNCLSIVVLQALDSQKNLLIPAQ